MAYKSTDNGRDDTRGMHHRPVPGEAPTARGADVSPPGSRERAEGHVTGWSPEKEEESMALRQGPFHQAATQRLYNPRGGRNAGDVGPQGRDAPVHGPRSMEDKEDGWGHNPPGHGRTYVSPPHGYRAREEDPSRTWREDPGGPHEGSRYGRAMGASSLAERPLRSEHEMRGEALSAEYRAGRGGWEEHPAPREHAGERRRWQREPLTAREIMTRGVKSVRRDSPLREVAQLMKDEDCGVVPIVDERGTLLGLVTDRDIVIRAFTGGKSPDTLRAGDVMTDDVQAVTPDEDIHGIIELMGRRQVRRIPVVDRDDRLLGIISMGDIAHRADYDEELQHALDRISARRSFWSRLG